MTPSNGEGGEGLKSVTGWDSQYLTRNVANASKKSRRGETLVWLQRISQFLKSPSQEVCKFCRLGSIAGSCQQPEVNHVVPSGSGSPEPTVAPSEPSLFHRICQAPNP